MMVKKVLLVTVSVLIMLGMMGCNGNSTPPDTGVALTPAATPPFSNTPVIVTTAPVATYPRGAEISISPGLWEKWEAENAPAPDSSIEAQLLELYLAREGTEPQDDFVVISASNSFIYPEVEEEYQEELEQQLAEFEQELAAKFKRGDISVVLDNFYKTNRNYRYITARSNKAAGRYIDYNDVFYNYLNETYGMDFWSLMMKGIELPGFTGYRSLSMPGYDPETGLVLIEDGTATGPTAGAGFLILLSYKDGVFTELGRTMTWIS